MTLALVELYRHNRWANLRLIDHLTTLDPKLLEATATGTFGRVDDTLKHIVANEEGYLIQLGRPPGETLLFHEYSFPGLTELRRRADLTGGALTELAALVQPGDTLSGTYQGNPYTMPRVVPLMQAINHATEHRAHIITTLSQQGIPPISLDAWTFWEHGMGQQG